VKDLQTKLSQSEETTARLKKETAKMAEDQAVQAVQSQDTERRLKEQVNYLTFERSHLEQKLKELYIIAKEQDRQRTDSTALLTQTNALTQERDSYKAKVTQLQEELDAANKRRLQGKENAKQDLALLKQDLDAGARIIQRQEAFIEDMRARLKVDTQHCLSLQKALEKTQQDLSRQLQDAAIIKQQLMDKENSIQRLQQEQQGQAAEIRVLKEHEVSDKRQREDWARQKMMLLDQRQREVAAMNVALHGFSN
jgi:hypothetical protein